jgi:hypothetical protein
MASAEDVAILDLPYADRQLIVVTKDLLAKVAREESSKGIFDVLKEVAKRDLRNVRRSIVERDWKGLAASVARIYFWPYLLPGTAAVEGIRAWSKARESGIMILQIGKTAAKALLFPPGHPRIGVLYIGHPTVPAEYYPMADFHRFTREHKFSEAIKLLTGLGATKIWMEHITGRSMDFSARLSVPLTSLADSVSLDAGKRSAHQHSLLYQASLDGTHKPSIPQGLVWYPHEPLWQEVANQRLKYGLKDFVLNVSYENDFGINADLKAKVLEAGLQLGGKVEDFQATVYRFEVTFSPSNG